MKGLMVKDLRLLGQQKVLWLMYIVLAAFLSFSMESSFIAGYLPMIAVLLVISTLSMDSYDNGMPFLMTLPVERKGYAIEKYLLSVMFIVLSWSVAFGLQLLVLTVKNEAFDLQELLFSDLLILPVFLIVTALVLPIELKFGADKGRIIMFIIFGIVALILIAGRQVLEFLAEKFSFDLSGIAETFRKLPAVSVVAGVAGIALVVLLISAAISIKIMNNKEF